MTSDLSSDVVEIFGTTSAFAALKSDGSVVTWGYWNNGHTAHNSYNLGAGDLFLTLLKFLLQMTLSQH